MNKAKGQRWMFDNVGNECHDHIQAKFIVEVRDDLQGRVIQSFNDGRYHDYRVGYTLDVATTLCKHNCWYYLEGQDKS